MVAGDLDMEEAGDDERPELPTLVEGPSGRATAPILSFTPVNCAFRISEGDDLSPRLALDLKPARGETISRPDRQELKEVEWSLEVYRGRSTQDRLTSFGAIGQLNYSAATDHEDLSHGEMGGFWVHLPEDQFDLLRDEASRGRLPTVLHFRVAGLSYGWEPDGSGKVWDVQNLPNTLVMSMDASYAFVAEGGADDAVPAKDDMALALTRNIEHALSVTVPIQIGQLKQLAAVAVIAVIGFAAVLAFR